MFDHLDGVPILFGVERAENVIARTLEDHDAVVKVVLLQHGSAVQLGQRGVALGLEGIVGTSMI